jgi:LPXTG-motif cell wall-anchored protein
MKTRIILVTALIALLALPVAVYAQETDPVTVTENFVTSVNEGDVAGAGDALAPDATVTVPEATTGEEEEEEAEPEAEAEYTGSAEYQAWLDAQAAAGAETTLGECTAAGEVVTCDVSYTSEALNAMGVGVLEGELEVVVVEGQIQAYDFIPSAEAVAMLQSMAAPAALPATGGTTATTYMLLAVVGLLLLLAGASVPAFRRSI